MTGSFGTNFTADSTTNLYNAILANSVFYFAQDYLVLQDAEDSDEYRLLARQYPKSQIDWLAKHIGTNPNEKARSFAVKMFFESDNTTLKTEILLRASRIFESKDAFKAFLVNTIIQQPDDLKSMRAVLSVSRGLIDSDRFVFDTFFSYASSVDFGFREQILTSLMRSRFFVRVWKEIKDLVDEESSTITRQSLVRALNHQFKYGQPAYFMADNNNFFDYKRGYNIDFFRRRVNEISIPDLKEISDYCKYETTDYATKMADKRILQRAYAFYDATSKLKNHDIFIFNFARTEIETIIWNNLEKIKRLRAT